MLTPLRNAICSWFALPVFADEETQRTATVLRAILLMGLVPAVWGAYRVLNAGGDARYTVPTTVTLVVGLVAWGSCMLLLRAGRVRPTAIAVSITIWLLAVALSFVSGGLSSPGTHFFFTAVLFAGVIVGLRAGVVLAALSIGAMFILVYLELSDIFLPNVLYTSPYTIGLTNLLNLGWVTAAVLIYTRRMNKALQSAVHSNRALQAIRNTLEERVTQRTADLTAANEQLRKLSRAVEQSPNTIVITDPQGRIEYVNPSFTRITGYTPDEVRGKKPSILKSGATSREEYKRLWDTITAGGEWWGEFHNRRKDGQRYWEYASIVPIRDAEGNITHFLKAGEDITPRKEAEQQRQHIFENALIGLYRTTPDGQVLMANPALLRMVGYGSLEELAQRNLEQTGYEPDYPRTAFKERMEREGRVVGLESAWQRHDGTTVHVRESAQAIRDASGRIVYYEGTVEDITERKRAEQSVQRGHERLEVMHLIDQAILAARSPAEVAQAALSRVARLVPCQQGGVLMFDVATQRVTLLAGWSDGGMGFPSGPAGPPPEVGALLNTVSAQGVLVTDDLSQQANLSFVEQMLLSEGIRSTLVVPLLAQGQFIGTINLGARRPHAYTEEHAQIAQEIANQVAIAIRQASLYASLENLNAELEEAIQAKDEMIANVSHELRTPLTKIMGYGDLLADGMLGDLTDEQRQAVVIMRDRAKSLNELVNILLTYQALTQEPLGLEPVAPGTLLSMLAERWHDEAAQRAVMLNVATVRGLPPLRADLLRLRQMMDQLLDNALKFTPQGGQVSVGAEAHAGEVWLSVADTGIGIPPDKLELVFERFYQLDGSSTRRYGGMGMGLALARQIAVRHGGRIWAESDGEGQGATFRVALPVMDAAESVPSNGHVAAISASQAA